MENLIERYVYDVVRRLPEKERAEVSKELKANIYDMLGESDSGEDIKQVLLTLGPPAELSQKYRRTTGYLISPAVFENYKSILKIVLPIVGAVLLVIGVIMGATQLVNMEKNAVAVINTTITSGFSMAVSGVMQAFVWITLGFAIAERTNAFKNKSKPEWNPDALPEIPPQGKAGIKLSDSIAEFILELVFSLIAILICSGVITFSMGLIRFGGQTVYRLFDPAFLKSCIPLILIGMCFALFSSLVKIIYRRWTPLVCTAVVLDNLAGIGIMLYLFTFETMFSAEFTTFIKEMPFGDGDLMRYLKVVEPMQKPLLIFVGIIVLAVCTIDIVTSIIRTVKFSAAQATGAVEDTN